MEERLAAFGLHVAPEKTAVLRFDGNLLHGTGRPAIKPATFTFLGFNHFLTKTRRGTINIGRTASIKARERFLRRQADWLRANRHLDVRKQQAHLRLALNGYYQYFGVRLAEQALVLRVPTDTEALAEAVATAKRASPTNLCLVGPLRQTLVPTPSTTNHAAVGLTFVLKQRMCSGEPGALIAHARF